MPNRRFNHVTNGVSVASHEKIAVLPLGATEQHGPHLPPETDWIIAEAVAERTRARSGDAIKLDILAVEKAGYSIEHSDDPRTVSLGFDEAVRRWVGIGEDLCRRGTRKFVMLNAHGGNSPLMTIAATELRARHRMLAVATSWTRFGTPPGLVPEEEKAQGIHGGFIETSVMLALRPDLVELEEARDFPSEQARFQREFTHLRAYGPHAFGWMMRDLSPEGVVGNAAAASREAGERLLEHAVSGFAELLADVDRFDLKALR
ncbi:creatininase family protein [Chelativorans sp. AA-79]|uniref:creatininase family protein n=1 Tax=Chelativorans sp. AA-79 TaxID=3028735 RepID=UPI0023F8DA5C|nr:creatininase family protein [Chelativorans sp. AA-79]WEX10153.1 creatininase family protein [Chelativorans sp. AA-79]